MKNKILLLTMIFAVSFSNGQNVKFGIKGGLNLSNLASISSSTDKLGNLSDKRINNLSDKGKVAFHIGGMVNISLTDSFSIQPELLYSLQGAHSETNFAKADLELHYISIPVMANLHLGFFKIEAGPQVSFLTSSIISGEVLGFGSSKKVKDLFSTVDFGVNFGLGIEFQKISLGTRFNIGLSDIIRDNPTDIKIINSVFQLSLGYYF